MLWYKSWLETRWRFIFSVGAIFLIRLPGLFRDPPPADRLWFGLQLGSTLICIFAALFLAGAGINSQTTYAATSGFHGSMLFTLSLPVSRRRLFFVRAAAGAIEAGLVIAAMVGLTLYWAPFAVSASQVFQSGVRVLVCALPVYALSALLACVFDEVWQFTGATMCLAALWMLQSRSDLLARFSPLRGLSLVSYPATAPMPWAPLIASVAAAAVLLSASVLILDRKQY